jgi:hypothetical protein
VQSLRFPEVNSSIARQSEVGVTGDERLSANNDADRLPPKERSETTRKGRRADPPGAVGRALKTVYDNTLREEVPDDFMDLLGKLS